MASSNSQQNKTRMQPRSWVPTKQIQCRSNVSQKHLSVVPCNSYSSGGHAEGDHAVEAGTRTVNLQKRVSQWHFSFFQPVNYHRLNADSNSRLHIIY